MIAVLRQRIKSRIDKAQDDAKQKRTQPVVISELVPRRISGTQGRRPPNYPDLNFRRIADAVGVSSTFVGRIMNGRARASMETAQKLAAYLGWPLDRVADLYESEYLKEKFPYVTQVKSAKESKPDGKSQQRAGRRATERERGTNNSVTSTTAAARKRKPVPAAVADKAHARKRDGASGAKTGR